MFDRLVRDLFRSKCVQNDKEKQHGQFSELTLLTYPASFSENLQCSVPIEIFEISSKKIIRK